MTPTQPAPLDDAGAMARIDRAMHYLEGLDGVYTDALEARAHLAARLAELTQQLEASIAMTGEQLRRADRAEAELAAARKLPAMILHDSWAGTASRLEAWAKQRSYQNLAGQTMEEAAAFIRHYLDAARGEGG